MVIVNLFPSKTLLSAVVDVALDAVELGFHPVVPLDVIHNLEDAYCPSSLAIDVSFQLDQIDVLNQAVVVEM